MIRLEPTKARPKKRAPYRGGTSVEATKPWLKEDPPMGRRTWYRHQAKKKLQDQAAGWARNMQQLDESGHTEWYDPRRKEQGK